MPLSVPNVKEIRRWAVRFKKTSRRRRVLLPAWAGGAMGINLVIAVTDEVEIGSRCFGSNRTWAKFSAGNFRVHQSAHP